MSGPSCLAYRGKVQFLWGTYHQYITSHQQFSRTLLPHQSEQVELATLTHRYPDWLGVDGYEKLLYDAINDDQSHFVHSDEVTESWRIVDDLLCTGDKCPIRTAPYLYMQGNWGPTHKTNFITNWDYPA